MAERWTYPVQQAMQRHTGSRLSRALTAAELAPPTVPAETPPETSTPPEAIPARGKSPAA